MTVKIAFKQIDLNYSQEYANQYNLGKESVNNMKYHWERSFKVNADIDEVSISKNQLVRVHDFIEDNQKFNLILDGITLIKCFIDKKLFVQYAVSDDLLEKSHHIYKEKENTKYYYFYLKDNLMIREIDDHFYILDKDIKSMVKK